MPGVRFRAGEAVGGLKWTSPVRQHLGLDLCRVNQDTKQTQVIRVLSGIQPTGELHLGNYMGAVRHWVTQQARVEALFLLADVHAITLPQNPRELRQKTLRPAYCCRQYYRNQMRSR